MKYISWLLIALMICGLVVGCSSTPASNGSGSMLEAQHAVEPEQLSLEQQGEIIQHCQSIALVAIEDSNCVSGYHKIGELLSTSSNLHYFVYATVDTLFYSAWQTYDWADEKRAEAFVASLGDNCIVEDYSAKIPESNIKAILSELFGEKTVSDLNWDDIFEEGYFLYEEGDPGSWMDLSISSTTDWGSTKKLDFSYYYEYTDEFSEEIIGQIQFSIKRDSSSKYGRMSSPQKTCPGRMLVKQASYEPLLEIVSAQFGVVKGGNAASETLDGVTRRGYHASSGHRNYRLGCRRSAETIPQIV